MRLDLDMPVNCADVSYGELADLVVEPSTRRVTHLVIQPQDRHDHARLVPLERADRRDRSDCVSLIDTAAGIRQLDAIQEIAYVRAGESPECESGWDVGIREMYESPAPAALGPQALGAGMTIDYDQHVVVRYHRIPKGTVELRRHSSVTASDGNHVGHLVGLILDDQGAIAQLVLEHGHLWGKHQVAVPLEAIERFENDELTLSISRDALGALKPLD
jgi:hypothetical protein